MLPGIRSVLLACQLASSSVAVRPSKFPLASFRHLLLRLSLMFPARQPSSLLLLTSSSRPPAPRPVLHCCRHPSCPVPLDPASSVAVVYDKRDRKRMIRITEESRKDKNKRIRTRWPRPSVRRFPFVTRLWLYLSEKKYSEK